MDTNKDFSAFYVSPVGDDLNNGLLPDQAAEGQGPFATVARAQTAVRELVAAVLKSQVRVFLRQGSYRLDQTLSFGPEDSGTAEFPVTYAAYPGERPVISGGRKIENWTVGTLNGKDCWTAKLPEVAAGSWFFTQLFIRGKRMPRTRLPATGFYRFTGAAGCPDNGMHWLHGPDKANFTSGQIRRFKNLADVEIVSYALWFETHHRVESVDEATGTVHFRAKSIGSLRDEAKEFARYIVENTFEAMQEPGQWYLDRPEGTLYYLPMRDEQPGQIEVVAPFLERIVELKARDGRKVSNVRFERISFHHAQWQLPDDVPGSVQAAFRVPGAIVLDGAEQCAFYACEVAHVAQYAIEVLAGSTNNRIVACEMKDLGAGGVKINHEHMERHDATVDHEVTGDVPSMRTTVTDCSIHHGGKIFPGTVGIMIGNSGRNSILHNHIFEMPYTGISCGWTWGYAPTRTFQNRIEFNHVHHINCEKLLSDNGGIYTLGISPGTTIIGNHVHDIGYHHYGGLGIYPDEGSSSILIEGNVVHHTQGGGLCIHYGRDNVVQNNIFALAKDAHFYAGKAESHRTTVFRRNIVYFEEGDIAKVDWSVGAALENYLFEKNILFNASDKPILLSGRTIEELNRNGQHLGTIQADPLFVCPEAGDFSMPPDSPAITAGFKPIDAGKAGPRYGVTIPGTLDDWPHDDVDPHPVIHTTWSLPQCGANPATDKQILVTMKLENVGECVAEGRMALAHSKNCRIDGDKVFDYCLQPGETVKRLINVAVGKKRGNVLLETVPKHKSAVPSAFLIQHRGVVPVAKLAAPDFKAAVAELANADSLVIDVSGVPVVHARFGISGDALVMKINVADSIQKQAGNPAEFWAGACVELFTSVPDSRSINQLVFVPGFGGAKQQCFHFVDTEPVPNGNNIEWDVTVGSDGYELTALATFYQLAVDGRKPFLLELAAETALPGQAKYSRYTLSGVQWCYKDNSRASLVLPPAL